MKDVFWCSTCLNMSTRNRIEFDENGSCNACTWAEEKKSLDWSIRENNFKDLIKETSNNAPFDVIVPVSGGKDGSYVTWVLKEKYGLNVLNVTCNPPLRSQLGYANLENFKKKSNTSLIEVNVPYEASRKLNKSGFINQGRPLYGWTTSIFSAVLRIASNFNINLIMYGENGEIEYGGSTESKNRKSFTAEFAKNTFLEGQVDSNLKSLNGSDMFFWDFNTPNLDKIKMAHWSSFEDWDSYRNYIVAKEKFGLGENESQSNGSYTNFAQNDTPLYDLHAYLMYLKFGFGRATQDAGIDIRRGAMAREQAINLAELYDNELNEDFIPLYLEYYQMDREEFDKTIDKWVNKDLFEKIGSEWQPKFKIK